MYGVVRRLFRKSVSGGRPFRMSGSCREAIPDIWEWSRDPPKFPVVVG